MSGADPRLVEAAHAFLDDMDADNDTLAALLAERMQDAAEDWIEEWFHQPRPPLRLVGDLLVNTADTQSSSVKDAD